MKGSSASIDFSAELDTLTRELCRRIPELGHIDPDRLLFSIARSRAEGTHGTYARIAPLRFAGGAREHTRRRGPWRETFRLPELHHQQREIYYLITIFIPRFLRLSFEQKLSTIVHELYHISETCDGDIRRFAGRNFAHGSSRTAYNRIIKQLVDRYLAGNPPESPLTFLHLDEISWQQQHVHISGITTPVPRARLVARSRS
ncbi:putative metallopeptidase [Trichloromonas sp.]|uniref:putative metallopeptidase n=1 Tax=Trichloromonas sp. TaxID=3069249 RepID=UPI003D814A80